MTMKVLKAGIIVITSLGLPLVLTDYGMSLTTEILIMAIFAMSLGLIMGYAGLISLGHAAFFGIGAYTIALLGQHVSSLYILILASVILSGAVAFITGALFIRTSHFFFLMITLAFCQMVFALVWQLKPITGGADGLKVTAVLDFGLGEIKEPTSIFYVMAISFLIIYFFIQFFVASPAGKIIKGIMENESRMKALGFNTRVYKLLVYTLSGMLAGFAGSLYTYFNEFVSPELTSWIFSGQLMLMVIIGGVGTLIGPVIGTGFYLLLQNYISSYTDRWQFIIGIIFIVLVLFGRGGIVHWCSYIWERVFPTRSHHSDSINPKEEQFLTKGRL